MIKERTFNKVLVAAIVIAVLVIAIGWWILYKNGHGDIATMSILIGLAFGGLNYLLSRR